MRNYRLLWEGFIEEMEHNLSLAQNHAEEFPKSAVLKSYAEAYGTILKKAYHMEKEAKEVEDAHVNKLYRFHNPKNIDDAVYVCAPFFSSARSIVAENQWAKKRDLDRFSVRGTAVKDENGRFIKTNHYGITFEVPLGWLKGE